MCDWHDKNRQRAERNPTTKQKALLQEWRTSSPTYTPTPTHPHTHTLTPTHTKAHTALSLAVARTLLILLGLRGLGLRGALGHLVHVLEPLVLLGVAGAGLDLRGGLLAGLLGALLEEEDDGEDGAGDEEDVGEEALGVEGGLGVGDGDGGVEGRDAEVLVLTRAEDGGQDKVEVARVKGLVRAEAVEEGGLGVGRNLLAVADAREVLHVELDVLRVAQRALNHLHSHIHLAAVPEANQRNRRLARRKLQILVPGEDNLGVDASGRVSSLFARRLLAVSGRHLLAALGRIAARHNNILRSVVELLLRTHNRRAHQ
eukprot:m.111795 g.111795  ORF g.111795 m.111795 type:complete len:315 (-) comp15960_c0_seq4:165-1109(-)